MRWEIEKGRKRKAKKLKKVVKVELKKPVKYNKKTEMEKK